MDAVELLATEKLSGGGRVDRSGESARRAARRSLSLAVKAAAIIGSVSSGPANLKNSCEFLFTFHRSQCASKFFCGVLIFYSCAVYISVTS